LLPLLPFLPLLPLLPFLPFLPNGTPVASTHHMVRLNAAGWVVLLGLGASAACAPALRYPEKSPSPPPLRELWQEPRDLAKRDLFHGVGGPKRAPNPDARYEFREEDTTGASGGYTVRDDSDREWDVKLGIEAQPELVVSRLLWAIGYHQPPMYFVPASWRLHGVPGWGKDTAVPQGPARFRLEEDSRDVVGHWSWYDNPFIGTRQFKGLILANFILGNWDYKESNNRIYEVDPPLGDAARLFVVQDLGAALGRETPNVFSRLRLRALRGHKNDPDEFEKTGFIRRVDGTRVEFEYDGMDPGLFEGITVADVKWLCGLFERLTDRQWDDAFRAAEYSEETRQRFIRKIKEKVAAGAAL
jgi:hypothetical protein